MQDFWLALDVQLFTVFVEVVAGLILDSEIDLSQILVTVRPTILTPHELNRGGFDLIRDPQLRCLSLFAACHFLEPVTGEDRSVDFSSLLEGHIKGADVGGAGDGT